MSGRVGTMSLATSCDITQHHAVGGGSGSGAGGVRCHSAKGVAEESRGGGSGSGRWAGVGSGRGSPYSHATGSEVEVRLYYECVVIHKLLTSGSIHRRQEHKLPR